MCCAVAVLCCCCAVLCCAVLLLCYCCVVLCCAVLPAAAFDAYGDTALHCSLWPDGPLFRPSVSRAWRAVTGALRLGRRVSLPSRPRGSTRCIRSPRGFPTLVFGGCGRSGLRPHGNVFTYCTVLYCPVLSCHVLSCPVLSCPSCPVMSCPVMSCHVMSCPVLSCPVLSSNSELLCTRTYSRRSVSLSYRCCCQLLFLQNHWGWAER